VSFSSEVKKELSARPLRTQTSVFYELGGMLKMRGILILKGKGARNSQSLVLHTAESAIARRIFSLFKQVGADQLSASYSVDPYLFRRKSYRIEAFGREIWYHMERHGFHLEGEESFLPLFEEDLGFFGDFLRGVFLVSGSIVDPLKEYHFEILEKDSFALMQRVQKTLKHLVNIHSGLYPCPKGHKLYIKRSMDLVEILQLMGAEKASAQLEQMVETRRIRSDVNRSINFTLANANKIGSSSFAQMKAIRTIAEEMGLDILDPVLKELAQLRMENEDLTLQELGERMKIPITKSAVYNRMKKIQKIARELSDEEETP